MVCSLRVVCARGRVPREKLEMLCSRMSDFTFAEVPCAANAPAQIQHLWLAGWNCEFSQTVYVACSWCKNKLTHRFSIARSKYYAQNHHSNFYDPETTPKRRPHDPRNRSPSSAIASETSPKRRSNDPRNRCPSSAIASEASPKRRPNDPPKSVS